MSVGLIACAGAALLAGAPLKAQPPGPPPGFELTFNSSVKRTFDNRCIACHGPSRQQGGLRLDSREGLMAGGVSGPAVVPFDRSNSRLYVLVAAHKMPLDAPLGIAEVEALGAWIDQGAVWPTPRRVPTANPDPRVEAYRSAIVEADRRGVSRLVRQRGFATARGRGGATALHYAALFGRQADLLALLDAGAAIDAADDRGVTPLMWAFSDPAKVRLLVERGADVNAAADDGTTALMIAAAQAGGADQLRYLAARGARPDPASALPLLTSALSSGDVEVLRAVTPDLVPPAGPVGELAGAVCQIYGSSACLEDLSAAGVGGPQLGGALLAAAAFGDAAEVQALLARGAPTVFAGGPRGIDALAAALASDAPDTAEKVSLLLAAGADPNVTGPDGRGALFYARERHPQLVPLLLAKGAK